MRKPVLAAVLASSLLATSIAPAIARDRQDPLPIPHQPRSDSVTRYVGAPAVAQPIDAPALPQNPFMSSGSGAAIHDDTYMSDTYVGGGPLGRKPVVSSTWLGTPREPSTLVAVMTFDQAGRIVAGAVVTNTDAQTANVRLTLIEPGTLATLATLDLPSEPMTGANFRPSGTYFYQDQEDRTVIGTAQRSVWVVSHDASSFTVASKLDLTGVVGADDEIEALQPDFSGRVWATSKHGMVATLDLAAGRILGWYRMPAGERIVNGHASDETGGVFIASSQAMYRFDADAAGAPAVTWREPYDAGTRQKPGQVDIGTGTTPTIMGSEYVTITDNADPQMHVLVYRRAKTVSGDRLACAVPVFRPYESDTENSLVATDRSIVVENNYGYASHATTTGGHTTTPGLTRIDIDDTGVCRTAWNVETMNIPSVVSKMSLANGLIYTYTKPYDENGFDDWYFTAVDFRTGQPVYSQLAGTGPLYNNHYAALFLGPDGTVYAGVLGGIVAMRDAE